MNCFTHEGVVAIGVCCGCGKGVCRSCVTDLGYALACSESCSTVARNRRDVDRHAERTFGVGGQRRRLPPTAMFFALFGALSLAVAIYNNVIYGELDFFSAGAGIIFLGSGLSTYWWVRRNPP